MAIVEQKTGDKDHMSILLYAKSGYGKTRFSATSGLEIPMCFVNIEKKKATLDNFIGKIKGKILNVDNQDDIIKILTGINNGTSVLKYEVFILDSLSRLQSINSLNIAYNKNQNATKLTLDDWNQINFSNNNLLTSLPSDKMHVICTTMATHKKRSLNDEIGYYTPTLAGQLADSIGGWFNIVVFIEKQYKYTSNGKETIRRFHFNSTDEFEAKSEFTGFPEFIDNPTFGELLKLWRGEALNREFNLLKK